MWHKLLRDARFHASLLELDGMVAEEVRARGCECGGVLHAAPYLRKPRGLPELPEEHHVRLSFCCAEDGCRKRATPPSLRFLGRRVYVATVVVLSAVLREGPTPTRMKRLHELTGVRRRTVERWCTWWRTAFVESGFFESASAVFMPPLVADSLPAAMLERFVGNAEARLFAVLRFLAPITGGAGSQVS